MTLYMLQWSVYLHVWSYIVFKNDRANKKNQEKLLTNNNKPDHSNPFPQTNVFINNFSMFHIICRNIQLNDLLIRYE